MTADVPLDAAPAPHPVTGGAGIVEPVYVPDAPEPPAQWAWGADYSPEKADAARREHEREQLEAGLEKSRTGFGARLRSAFGVAGGADWDEIEETLITGDVGAALSMDLVERARKRRDVSAEEAVRAELAGLLAVRDAEHWEPVPAAEGAPAIVLVVGVNGTGKTTTIGKLAARERAKGRRVVLAAADTFRAAAIDQLRIWAQRTDSEIVAHAPNADPAAVVFDALDAAVARHADILIADTAGRLHTKSNLMDELSKVRRVIDKRIPGARVETFFVLDATTGQNGLAQAKAFHEAVGLTGVVLTKLDSTAKGGIVFAIEKELGVPVRFVGVGEKAEDLLPFDPEAFVAGAVRVADAAARVNASPLPGWRRPRLVDAPHPPHGRAIQPQGPGQREQRPEERRRAQPDGLREETADDRADEGREHHHDPHRRVHPPQVAVLDARLAHRDLGDVVDRDGGVADELLAHEERDRDERHAGRGERDQQVPQRGDQQRRHHEPAEPEPPGRPLGEQRPHERPEPAERRHDADDGRIEAQLVVREQQPRRAEHAPHRATGQRFPTAARGGPGRGPRSACPRGSPRGSARGRPRVAAAAPGGGSRRGTPRRRRTSRRRRRSRSAP